MTSRDASGGRGDRLGARLVEGLRWKAAGQGLGLLLRFAAGIVVARALGPDEMGLAAMALAVAALGHAYADVGLASALIQRAELDERDRSTAFWVTVASGVLLTGVGVAIAGAVAGFFDEPRVRWLFAAVSAGFLIGALGATQSALLQRASRWKALESRRIVAGITSTAVGVGIALWSQSAWAVVAQTLCGSMIAVGLFWTASSWRPRLLFSFDSLRALGGYSFRLLGSRLFFGLHRNADNLIVGRQLGAASLGHYALAYNLMMLPFQRVVDPVRSVLFPLFAEVQDQRERVAALWLRSTRAIAALLFPALIGLLVVADDLVATFLGPPWEPAIPVLRVLAATGLVQTLIAINSVVLSALGRVDALLRFSVFTFAAAVTGFLVGVRFGITGVAVGYLVANLLVVPPYLRLSSNAVGTSVLALPRAVAGAAGVAAAMAVAVVTTRLLLEAAGVAAPVRLGACVVLGAAIVAWLLARRVPALRADVESALRSAKNRTGSVVASS